MRRLDELELANRRVLIRADLNVPLDAGRIVDDTRVRASLPSIRCAQDAGAAVIVLSHLGRPREGEPDDALSLAPVARRLEELLGRPVAFVRDWLDGGLDAAAGPGRVALCENVRFCVGEAANDEALARRIAALGEVFVMDAFGAAHRAHASTVGVARHAQAACAGLLLCAELAALKRVGDAARRPFVAIVGGAKISTKLPALRALAARADRLILGGGIANTWLAAHGARVGRSLQEPDMHAEARDFARDARARVMPIDDAVCAAGADAPAHTRALADIGDEEMIFDFGPRACARAEEWLADAATVLWNGPPGLFERAAFAAGTERVARAVAASPAYSVAGGGETLAAVNRFGAAGGVSHLSTGGGALLRGVARAPLPAVEALG